MIRRTTSIMILPAILLAAAACSGTESSLLGSDVTDPTALTSRFIAPASVTLSPAQATLEVGKNFKLAGTVLNKEGHAVAPVNTVAMRWASSDTTIAKVSGSGVVVALKPGSVMITALAGSVSATSTISVHQAGQPVPSNGVSTAAPSTPVSETSASTSAGSTGAPTTSSTSTETSTPAPAPAAPSAPAAPTPSTVPSTSQPSSTNGTGLSGFALVSDDFRQYSSTASLLNNISKNSNGGTGSPQTSLYFYVDNGNLLQLDPSVQFNGHPSMKFNMPGGTASVPELQVYFPGKKTLTDMWLRVTIRFSPGWTTDGTLTNSGKGYKLLGWGWGGPGGRGSVEFGPVTDMTIGWYVFSNAGNSMAPYVFSHSIPQGVQTGTNWYDVVVHYQQTSSTTVREQWWMGPNGTALTLQGDLQGSMIAGQTVPAVDHVMLGMNFNQIRAAAQSQAIWYGQWEVVDGSQHAHPFGL